MLVNNVFKRLSPLGHNKALNADDKINEIKILKLYCERVENIMGKGENAGS